MSAEALDKLFRRYRHQFTDGSDTAVIFLSGKRNAHQVRVFSPEGALMIVRHARTLEADRIFRLLLDFLNARARKAAARLPTQRILDLAASVQKGEALSPDVLDVVELSSDLAGRMASVAKGQHVFRKRAKAIGFLPREITALRRALSATQHGTQMTLPTFAEA